jgi:murein DD-endopeptidase MepM/ murein hydrolase activator NlpD
VADIPHEARHRAGRQGASRHQAQGRRQAPATPSRSQPNDTHQAPATPSRSQPNDTHQAPAALSRSRASVRRQAPAKPSRIFAGLALPTAATVALMFCAAGAAVATSAKTQTARSNVSASAKGTPRPPAGDPAARPVRQAAETERAEAALTTSSARANQQDLALLRATSVARGVERTKIAAAAAAAKREAFAHSWRLPMTDPRTTSGFGYRWGRLHAGEDFAVDVGTPLAAMSSGTVVFAGEESGFGNLVEIRYWDGTISYYGHMSVISVNVGESVAPGEIVGESGNTGRSTGPHLHLEIHPDGGEAIDPLPWLEDRHISP